LDRKERRWLVVVCVVQAILSSLPYLVAWAATPYHSHFTGLLFNPQDGHSYIAKMRQGLNGSWLFRLPYTSEPQDGAPVFVFYLLLGHIARWTGLPVISVYHIARVASGLLMTGAIYALARRLSDEPREQHEMVYLAVFGSGFGWFVSFLGVKTADLWVAEAYPFYACMMNPHFPFSMALMVIAGLCGLRLVERVNARDRASRGWGCGLGVIGGTIGLGAVQPYGLPGVFGGLGTVLLAQAAKQRKVPWRAGAWIGSAAALAAVYPLFMQSAILRDPVLAVWSAQNVTKSPPVWNWALSLGVVLLLALPGVPRVVQRGTDGDWFVLGWLGITFAGLYVPLSLQRRLSLGLMIPLGLLAGMGWWRAVKPHIAGQRWRWLRKLSMAVSAFTTVFLILGVLVLVFAGESRFYLGKDEWDALNWLREEGQPEVVLCAPEIGMFVPAWAGQPVVYGHPHETASAQQRLGEVTAFWKGEMTASERTCFLHDRRVRYIFVGPRERELGTWQPGEGGPFVLVFDSPTVAVYEYER